MKLNSLQYAIYTLAERFVERQNLVMEIMTEYFPHHIAFGNKQMTMLEYMRAVKEAQKTSQSGYWGKDNEWAYFFHGGGCRLTHTLTQEPIEWDSPDIERFDRYWFVNWLEWLTIYDATNEVVTVVRSWRKQRNETLKDLIFPILDQLVQLELLFVDNAWHRYGLVRSEKLVEHDPTLEVSIMHRLFIAIDLPDAIKNQLENMLAGVSGAKWVRRNQLHLTLRFIGEVETPRFQEIKASLQAVRAQPFAMTLQGVGRFPPKGAPRVLWVGASAPPALSQLQRRVEDTLVGIGIPAEQRPFSAHITLARLKSPPPPESVRRYLAQHAAFETGAIPIREFILYSSVLSPQGPTYRPEARFALQDYNENPEI